MSLLGKAKNPLGRILMGAILGFLSIGLMSLPALANVDNFKFKSLDVDYHLSLDEEGHSLLRVKEVFVAEFPEFDQNRGIVRAIPLSYRKHSVNMQLGEIYRNGYIAPIAKDTIESGFRRLEIRGNNYLHGENIYEINYTMRDVTLDPDNADIQEFYWDVNGNNWGQSFDSVTARLSVADNLRDKLTGKSACYTGFYGSTNKDCVIIPFGDELAVSTADKLLARQTLTMVVGFKPGTFLPYQMSALDKTLVGVSKIVTGLLVVLVVILLIRRRRFGNGAKVDLPVVTQYLPPADLDVLQSATLIKRASSGAVATLVDLAVRHKVQIKELKKETKSWLGVSGQDYEIEVIDSVGLTKNETAILKSYIKGEISNGSVRKIKHGSSDDRAYSMIQSAGRRAFNGLKQAGYYQDITSRKFWVRLSVFVMLLAIANMALATWRDTQAFISEMGAMSGLSMFVAVAAGFLIASFSSMRLRTDRAAEAVHYLDGLKRYIKLAEAERLAFAQSVDTAQTMPGKTEAERRVILYERLLPYAMLFGLEKSWAKVLELAYQDSGASPYWYIGSGSFSASSFSQGMSSFVSSTSSSSSSGSSGGGSAGGGGGGGGGGGC